MPSETPNFLLFAQHGWADTNNDMLALAHQLVDDSIPIFAPNLGFVETWIRIEPLIQSVEQIAQEAIATYPNAPLRVIGHSMGGLIWLEVLNRHPDWWERVESLVLLASPVGGADLGRIIDPLGLGVGIAADLGTSRRMMAESIAQTIPTLSVAGDLDGGSDGTVPVEATRFAHARFISLTGIAHPQLKKDAAVISIIQDFWQGKSVGEAIAPDPVIQALQAVSGMTDGHLRDFAKSDVLYTLNDRRTIRVWANPLDILHVYLASAQGTCLYSGFVGWIHTDELKQTLKQIRSMETKDVLPFETEAEQQRHQPDGSFQGNWGWLSGAGFWNRRFTAMGVLLLLLILTQLFGGK